jgi:hypothetical protein
MDTLNAGAERSILSALPAESMILSALFGHVISYYTITAAAKKKNQLAIMTITDFRLSSTVPQRLR